MRGAKGSHPLITRSSGGPSPLVPRDPPGGRVVSYAKQRQLTHENVFTITTSASVSSVPSVADSLLALRIIDGVAPDGAGAGKPPRSQRAPRTTEVKDLSFRQSLPPPGMVKGAGGKRSPEGETAPQNITLPLAGGSGS